MTRAPLPLAAAVPGGSVRRCDEEGGGGGETTTPRRAGFEQAERERLSSAPGRGDGGQRKTDAETRVANLWIQREGGPEPHGR